MCIHVCVCVYKHKMNMTDTYYVNPNFLFWMRLIVSTTYLTITFCDSSLDFTVCIQTKYSTLCQITS